MGKEVLTTFNSGELSPLLSTRTDIEKYRGGCAVLENMFILPQGGVQRRAGTEYIDESLSGEIGKLLPFNFSEDSSYILEFGIDIIKVYDKDGDTGVTIPHPYTIDEVKILKYRRVFDIMYITCPTKPVQLLSRVALSPLEFTLVENEFNYPPLYTENDDTNKYINIYPQEYDETIEYTSGDQVSLDIGLSGHTLYSCSTDTSGTWNSGDWDQIYIDGVDVDAGNELTLTSSDNVFTESQEGSYFNIKQARSEHSSGTRGTFPQKGTFYTEPVKVSEKSYVCTFNWGWDVSVDIETSLNGVDWTNIETYNGSSTYFHSTTYNGIGAAGESIRLRKYHNSRPVVNVFWNYEIRADSNRRVTGTFSGAVGDNINGSSEQLDVSFSNWTVTTDGDWNGVIELEKSYNNGDTWGLETIIGDTFGLSSRKNFALSSPAKEGANTSIRISFNADTDVVNELEYSIVNDNLYSEGIVKLDTYIDATRFDCTVVNTLGSAISTYNWTEGAFSGKRGYPTSVEYYEDRIVYSGTQDEPSTVWASIAGDYNNFQLGTNDDEAFKFTPASPERTEWLLARKDISQGNAGGIIKDYSVDEKSMITPSTIKSTDESSFGCSNIQAIFANDVSIYVQRLGKKLRELVFNFDEDQFNSNDLTILSEHITESGIKEIAFQKTPDQFIWCLMNDGTVACLTYERNEEISGWHRYDFGGVVQSIGVRPSNGEDELWMIITRDGGNYVERIKSRDFNLDLKQSWFVDSGKQTKLLSQESITSWSLSDEETGHITINCDGHGLVTGDIIKLCNVTGTISEFINDNKFLVDKLDDDSFKLKSLDGGYINYFDFNMERVTASDWNGTPRNYEMYGFVDGHINYVNNYYNSIKTDSGTWRIIFHINTWGLNDTIDGIRPPLDDWYDTSFLPIDPQMVITQSTLDGGSFTQVSNVWDGLSHLNGETVQIQGDGGFVGTSIVVNGEVTTDDYYNQTVIGLRFISIVQPMNLELLGSALQSMGEKKRINKVVASFNNTVGGVIGTINCDDDETFSRFNITNYLNGDYDTEDIKFRRTTDNLGEPLELFTGGKLQDITDSWSNNSEVFIVQDLPMPMTVLGITASMKMGVNI